uniref:Thioredoxin domain-containing protein n=1 Tax=Ditylenchus dipsaci TaxID=166011 RepID=A0A915EUA9_9BILA
MKSCSSAASTSSEEVFKSKEEDKDSGICSLYCLASCLNSATNYISSDTNNAELNNLLTGSGNVKPFLRRSIFSNVPPTISFYTKGNKVKKPVSKFTSRLTWCHNSLLPLVIRQSLAASHFKVVDESKTWFGYWGRHLKSAQYKKIKPYQKVNHFPGAFHMGRKDRLWQHLAEMMSITEDDFYSIMPILMCSTSSIRHVILKPPASARGTGISIVSRFNHIPPKTSLVAQHYVESPFIINNAKFDLRLVPYSSSLASYSNQYMHLTNYSINKLAQENGSSEHPVPKWTLAEFWDHIEKQGYDSNELKNDINNIAIKAVTACESHIREHQALHSDFPFVSHELFGMDVLIDSTLKPWLIEMNISPSLHSATSTDVEVKAPLARDVLNMCGLVFPLSQDDFTLSMNYRTKHFFGHKSPEHLEKEAEHLAYFIKNMETRNDILQSLTDADQYLNYIKAPVYSNILLHEWQKLQLANRQKGIEILQKLCDQGKHIVKEDLEDQVEPENSSSVEDSTSEEFESKVDEQITLLALSLGYSDGLTHVFSIEDDEDFDERVVNADVPVLVDFHADWCGPCKNLGPRLESKVLAQQGKILLAKINVDSAGDLADDYDVHAVPTVIAFKDGHIFHRFEGDIEDGEIDQLLANLMLDDMEMSDDLMSKK